MVPAWLDILHLLNEPRCWLSGYWREKSAPSPVGAGRGRRCRGRRRPVLGPLTVVGADRAHRAKLPRPARPHSHCAGGSMRASVVVEEVRVWLCENPGCNQFGAFGAGGAAAGKLLCDGVSRDFTRARIDGADSGTAVVA